jgi:hypothetical protein
MLFTNRTFKYLVSILLSIIFLLCFVAPTYAQSFIQIKIGESDLNTAVSSLKLTGQERQEGRILGIPWGITVNWWLDNFRLNTVPNKILVLADGHAEGGRFNYTDDIEAEAAVQMVENSLLIDISSAKTDLYFVNPITRNRIELAEIDVGKLIDHRAIEIDLPLKESYTIRIPEGGEREFFLGEKTLAIDNDFIAITSQVSVAES